MQPETVETVYDTHSVLEVIDLDSGNTIMIMTLDQDRKPHMIGGEPSVRAYASGKKPRLIKEEYHNHGTLLKQVIFASDGSIIKPPS